ncbi:MAG: YlxR family protein [Actinobacteria bacterium]|nr:YlxR family protein [Actinomycetota bacterium]
MVAGRPSGGRAQAGRDGGRGRAPGFRRVTAGVVGGEGPRRTCIGCRRVAGPADLVRVVRTADGSLTESRRAPGRGAWLCAGSPACVDKAERGNAFSRALRAPVAASAVATLRVLQSERARIEGCGNRSRKG